MCGGIPPEVPCSGATALLRIVVAAPRSRPAQLIFMAGTTRTHKRDNSETGL